MKNSFIVTLLFFCISATVALAQTKKPTTTTKKPTTTTKSSVPKSTTTIKKTTTTSTPVTPPPVVEDKKTTTTTTTTTTPTETKSTTTPTTTTQSSGPSKGKKNAEPKPERVREPKPERVKQPKPEKVRVPREPNGSSGGVRFGIRAETSQFISFEQGAGLEFSPGFNAGLIINFPLSKKIAIQPEVLNLMTSIKSTLGTSGDYVKNTGGSILAPVLVNINLGNGPTKFMINFGGYAEYALSVSSEKSTSGVKTVLTGDLTGQDRFFYGVVGGIGVKLNNKFTIETRSFYDLKNSDSNSIFTTLGIGYMF